MKRKIEALIPWSVQKARCIRGARIAEKWKPPKSEAPKKMRVTQPKFLCIIRPLGDIME